MKFFKTKQTQPVATPVMATIPENHVSKKKKNTYQIKFSTFAQDNLFSLCKNTPLAVVVLNGKQVQNTDGWMTGTEFPNPCANEMQSQQSMLREILGEEIATQIIEYLDKETGEPVLQLYPSRIHFFRRDYAERLNHATRRDLARQIAVREQLARDFFDRQKRR